MPCFCRSLQLLPENSPFLVEQVVDSDIDTFNDLMVTHHISEEDVNTYRQARRKGKNRVGRIRL